MKTLFENDTLLSETKVIQSMIFNVSSQCCLVQYLWTGRYLPAISIDRCKLQQVENKIFSFAVRYILLFIGNPSTEVIDSPLLHDAIQRHVFTLEFI